MSLDDGEVETVEFHEGPHRERGISHPMKVVRATWSLIVWSSNNSSLPLNVQVGHEKGIHFLIERGVKAHSFVPAEADLSAGAQGEVASGHIFVCILFGVVAFMPNCFPAASLQLTLLLGDAMVATLCPEIVGDLASLRIPRDSKQSC
jgi:hypothetical protein